jgi:hypothetical protein
MDLNQNCAVCPDISALCPDAPIFLDSGFQPRTAAERRTAELFFLYSFHDACEEP